MGRDWDPLGGVIALPEERGWFPQGYFRVLSPPTPLSFGFLLPTDSDPCGRFFFWGGKKVIFQQLEEGPPLLQGSVLVPASLSPLTKISG